MNKQIKQQESKIIPVDCENKIIIVPNNIEIQTICTNLSVNFNELEQSRKKKEEIRQKQEARKNNPNPFQRKAFQLQKKRPVMKQPQINRQKVIENIKKLKRAILSLEKEIKDLTENDDKSDDKKNKEIEEINHLTELTTKWKAACQEGIIELQKQLTDTYPDMTMNKIVDLLKVDPKDIDYDPETQDFV